MYDDKDVLYREMNRLDRAIWNMYMPKAAERTAAIDKVPSDWRIQMWLRADIESVMLGTKLERFEEIMDETVRKSPFADKIIPLLELDRIKDAVLIRKDWAAALKSVKHGRELSRRIEYGFSGNDLMALARLHKANRYRKKIEQLLTDCNFHTECCQFSEGDYSVLDN